ncbi:MAG TPA: ABC transporter permease subunit [Bacteroidales bacterium]|nr:ABC transporter permease subunit [Bacteroidales bacterium]
MLKTIILTDIKQNIQSFKLHVTFIIMMVVFTVGSIAYVFQYRDAMEDYRDYSSKMLDKIRKEADINTTRIAIEKNDQLFAPLNNGFIDDAKSQFTPNNIQYSAYNVFGYSISRKTSNPYLYLSNDLNWVFILSIITSFSILLLSYDAISGEREQQTLKLILSNAVSRGVLLFGKYFSIIISGVLMVLPGLLVSLIILILSGTLKMSSLLAFETIGFLVLGVLFISTISALGLLCSVVSRTANVSLLIGLTLWAVFLIFSPNLAVFAADQLFKIKNSETIQAEEKTAKDAINKAAPEGSWSMWGNNPFFPKHELRAKNITNLMNAEKQIKDEWYNSQFRQYEKAIRFTYLSPISILGMASESLAGSGYPRFRKNWDDLHTYQNQFLTWFKAIDAKDPKSPHWYNPEEDISTSREKIKFEEIPLYTERMMTIPQRLTKALPGIMLLVFYSFLLFGITVVMFNRYDVR